jgi:hypothetical protein
MIKDDNAIPNVRLMLLVKAHTYLSHSINMDDIVYPTLTLYPSIIEPIHYSILMNRTGHKI